MSQSRTQERPLIGTVNVGQWNVRLFGDFQLLDPGGLPIHLRTRKQEALLAILALNRNLGIEREVVAEILWADRPEEKRRASLRQALLDLRAVLGPDAIDGSRTHLRLSSAFPLFLQAATEDHAEFMPGHEGRWFDERRRKGPFEDMPAMPPQILIHFRETLSWYSQNDLRGMHAMLRASPYMVRGLDHRDLLGLLKDGRPDPATAGWASYWQGTAEEDLQLCIRLLRSALTTARDLRDYELASMVCLELGKAYSRTGQVSEARVICDFAEEIAAKTGLVRARVDSARLRGTLEIHMLNVPVGIELLTRAQDAADNYAEWMNIQALRAYMSATTDRFEEATMLLAAPSRFIEQTAHASIKVLCGMTNHILSLTAGRPADAVPRLVQYSAETYASGVTQFGVYADELLARLYRKIGDRDSARLRLEAARKGRLAAQMAVTPLESKQVRALD